MLCSLATAAALLLNFQADGVLRNSRVLQLSLSF